MKISKIFHWLYLSLLVLPIVTIPVFMIYSHRHDLTQRTDVDIQYKYQSNEVNNADDLIQGNVYQFNIEDHYVLNIVPNVDDYILIELLDDLYFDAFVGDSTSDFPFVSSHTILFLSFNDDVGNFYTFYSYEQYLEYDYTTSYVINGTFLNNITIVLLEYYISDLDNFYSYFSYSDYNVIESVSVNDTESDIMSQFTYSLYNTTERYYNFDNFFALGDIRQWFNTNFFNGNPSLGFGIAWHLLTYWFVVSIFWLIFDVLMYLPLLVHRWLDKGAIA